MWTKLNEIESTVFEKIVSAVIKIIGTSNGKKFHRKVSPRQKNPPQNFLKTKKKNHEATSREIKIPTQKFQIYFKTKIKDSSRQK